MLDWKNPTAIESQSPLKSTLESDTESGFLQRWSQRKQAALRQDRIRVEKPPQRGSSPESSGGRTDLETGLPEDSHEQTTMPPDLPAPETLTLESDFTCYLGENVPETIRQAALRHLWRLDPIFANLDGLNDYDHDYKILHAAIAHVKTAYQVGRGMPDLLPSSTLEPENSTLSKLEENSARPAQSMILDEDLDLEKTNHEKIIFISDAPVISEAYEPDILWKEREEDLQIGSDVLDSPAQFPSPRRRRTALEARLSLPGSKPEIE